MRSGLAAFRIALKGLEREQASIGTPRIYPSFYFCVKRSYPQVKRSSCEAFLFDRFGPGEPVFSLLIAEAIEFEAKLGIIRTDQEIIFIALLEGN